MCSVVLVISSRKSLDTCKEFNLDFNYKLLIWKDACSFHWFSYWTIIRTNRCTLECEASQDPCGSLCAHTILTAVSQHLPHCCLLISYEGEHSHGLSTPACLKIPREKENIRRGQSMEVRVYLRKPVRRKSSSDIDCLLVDRTNILLRAERLVMLN